MKYIIIFLTVLLILNNIETNSVPIFETPEIKRGDSPLRQNYNPRIANVDKSTKPDPWGPPDARNDLIRQFSLKRLEKWLKGVKGVNLNKVTDNVIIGNLNELRTISIALQQHVHQTCAVLSTKLKQLDLKLKEIKQVEKKVFQLKPGFVKKTTKKLKRKGDKLKKALKKEKKRVKRILRELKKKEGSIIKILKVYDKKFHKKHGKKG